jgi:hypothetical protein
MRDCGAIATAITTAIADKLREMSLAIEVQ